MSPGVEGDYTVEEIPVDDSTVYFLRPNRDDGTPSDHGFELRWFHDNGTAWLFKSQGLDRDALVAAALSATPTADGHLTIAEPGFEQLTSGSSADGLITSQDYTQDGGLIQLSVERNGTRLQQLTSGANIVDVTVAGVPGYAASSATTKSTSRGTPAVAGGATSTSSRRCHEALTASSLPSCLPTRPTG